MVIVLLAASIDQLELRPGKKAVFSSEEKIAGQIQEKPLLKNVQDFNPPFWFIYLLYVPIIYFVYGILKRLEWAPIKDKGWKRYMFVLVVLLLLVFLIILGLDFLNHTTVDLLSDSSFRDPEVYRDPEFRNYYSHLFLVLFILMLSGLLLGCVKLITLVFGKTADNAILPGKMIVEVKKTVAEIHAGMSPKETIIQCYARMCNILVENRDVSKKESMTPQEFSQNLTNLGFESEHISQLTGLFEKARYSNSDFTSEQTDRALSCLGKIIDQYRGKDEP